MLLFAILLTHGPFMSNIFASSPLLSLIKRGCPKGFEKGGFFFYIFSGCTCIRKNGGYLRAVSYLSLILNLYFKLIADFLNFLVGLGRNRANITFSIYK
ncbi:hypothetical protein CN601_13485 [Bacillus sp. AFS017336]|nr:hypothetical protein CN692_02795 [Bacillus sp. AFS002410]PEL10746.1 hypothetical protein CN601_13485 [Bacillus sp. AFS017336]